MVRTRFAPSPTGFVHIGSLRTALYNFLFARHNAGTFILRIEDTDRTRLVEGATENLIRILKWAGLEYDEGPNAGGNTTGANGKCGPYIQSERTEIYRKHAQKLLEQGDAYPCFCTSERLESMRQRQTELKQAPMYDRTCLKLTKEEIESKIAKGEPYVLRQKIPHGRKLKFKDLVRDHVSFDTDTIDDQVLIKSDNFPTYHLANVIDDHLMEITHVIRGEEWLPSTPKHILLYEAFGWTPPEFAHIPLLLNKDKSKLSKRQGDVSVEDYINKGILPEALINFVALLGWHPGKGEETEIFSLQELIEKFSIEQVHKSGAIFDMEKLNWFNFQLQRKNLEEKVKQKTTGTEKYRGQLLKELCEKYLPASWSKQEDLLLRALATVEEKILKNPAETEQNIQFYFNAPNPSLDLILNAKAKVDAETAKKALEESLKLLESLDDSSFNNQDKLKEEFLALAQRLNLKNGQILWPVRVALTGEQFSPGAFEVIWAFGKDESIKRLKKVLATIKQL